MKTKIIHVWVVLILSLNYVPLWGQNSVDSSVVIPHIFIQDSSYLLKNQKIYEKTENSKLKFKAHLKIYKYAIDSSEVCGYLDTLFANKNDTLILKTGYQYNTRFVGLYRQKIVYKAVYKNGPKVKFFEPIPIGKFKLYWLFILLPIVCFVGTMIIFFLGIYLKKKRRLRFFLFTFASSFLLGLWITAIFQGMMVDILDIPLDVAEIFISHPPLYTMGSWIILAIAYAIYKLMSSKKGKKKKEKKIK